MKIHDAYGRFDPGAVWDQLPRDYQRSFGLMALTLGRIEHLREIVRYDEMAPQGLTAQVDWADAIVGDVRLRMAVLTNQVAGLPALTEKIDTAQIGVRTCRECGCSDDHPCEGGCSWVPGEIDLCSACAAAVRP